MASGLEPAVAAAVRPQLPEVQAAAAAARQALVHRRCPLRSSTSFATAAEK